MKIAIIGGGVSGLSAAHGLRDKAEVVIFEARQRLGGHADTHNLFIDGQAYAIDTGFSVFNRQNYPGFSAWLETLGVATQPVPMTFGVSETGGLEYGTADLAALFSQRRNLVSPRFITMLGDMYRFNRAARRCVEEAAVADSETAFDLTLGSYLEREKYGAAFVNAYLLPVCVSLWSLPASKVRNMPFVHVAAFLEGNQMLRFGAIPGWEALRGGSNSYVAAFVSQFKGELRLGQRVTHVDRSQDVVRVDVGTASEHFDHVVFACDAQQALGLIDPSETEQEILGSVDYQLNRAVVHSDESFMPVRRSAWSSWNVVGEVADEARVTRWVNSVQSIPREQQFFVSLNPSKEPRRVWAERTYQLPVFTAKVRAAQKRRSEISGQNRSIFCGAYWGGGGHEDGFMSGQDIAQALSLARDQAA